jgi:hypothetical protein
MTGLLVVYTDLGWETSSRSLVAEFLKIGDILDSVNHVSNDEAFRTILHDCHVAGISPSVSAI